MKEHLLTELEKVIKNNIEEIKNVFFNQESKFSGNKIELFTKQFSDLFRKEKISKFFKLGYTNNLNINIFRKEDNQTLTVKRQIFKLAVDNERTDLIDFLMLEKYFNHMDFQDVVEQTITSEKVLNHIMKNYKNNLNEVCLERMISSCAYRNLDKSIEIICKENHKLIGNFTTKQMNGFLFTAIENHSNKVAKKLLNKEFSFKYDVNFISEENKSFFLSAAERKNYQILHHLISSHTLDFHTNVSKQVYLLKKIPHLKEIYPLLTLNDRLEKELESHNLLKEFKTFTLYNKLSNNLNEENRNIEPKIKVKKSKI